ncbi:uncharacterized protein FYN16_014554 isoform 2-T2 [Cariama cristata]
MKANLAGLDRPSIMACDSPLEPKWDGSANNRSANNTHSDQDKGSVFLDSPPKSQKSAEAAMEDQTNWPFKTPSPRKGMLIVGIIAELYIISTHSWDQNVNEPLFRRK